MKSSNLLYTLSITFANALPLVLQAGQSEANCLCNIWKKLPDD